MWGGVGTDLVSRTTVYWYKQRVLKEIKDDMPDVDGVDGATLTVELVLL
jgi:hypothetical protein